MNSFQEWSEQLSKKAPIQIPLSKIAVAPDDSWQRLNELLDAGYDKVIWINCEDWGSPCPRCAQIAKMVNGPGGVDLANFLGFRKVYLYTYDAQGNEIPKVDAEGKHMFEKVSVQEVYKNAPIYNWAHVGCKCFLEVIRTSDGESEFVSREG